MNNALTPCCSHGVPTGCGCYCRWCVEGGAPAVEAPIAPAERSARVAKVEADLAALRASLPVRKGRGRRA